MTGVLRWPAMIPVVMLKADQLSLFGPGIGHVVRVKPHDRQTEFGIVHVPGHNRHVRSSAPHPKLRNLAIASAISGMQPHPLHPADIEYLRSQGLEGTDDELQDDYKRAVGHAAAHVATGRPDEDLLSDETWKGWDQGGAAVPPAAPPVPPSLTAADFDAIRAGFLDEKKLLWGSYSTGAGRQEYIAKSFAIQNMLERVASVEGVTWSADLDHKAVTLYAHADHTRSMSPKAAKAAIIEAREKLATVLAGPHLPPDLQAVHHKFQGNKLWYTYVGNGYRPQDIDGVSLGIEIRRREAPAEPVAPPVALPPPVPVEAPGPSPATPPPQSADTDIEQAASVAPSTAPAPKKRRAGFSPIFESYTMDFTGRIHHAQRESDGQWFKRHQFKDPRYGYKWGAWKKDTRGPENAGLPIPGNGARLPRGDGEGEFPAPRPAGIPKPPAGSSPSPNVGDTMRLTDIAGGPDLDVQFRGFDDDHAVVLLNGMQMRVPRDRVRPVPHQVDLDRVRYGDLG